MKKLAAHDFEDLLQCTMPVFENLLPEPHNKIVLDLLFDLSVWHGYAKLRMHTEDTLVFFDTATVVLGQSIRTFYKITCSYYYTTELPHEYAARGRREAALAAKQPSSSGNGKQKSGPKFKALNLSTYKFHALGHYPNTIRHFGTTDSYSTQPGELEHRQAKRWYPRTAKNKKTMIATMTRLESRECVISQINQRREELLKPRHEPRERTSPAAHYHISKYPKLSYDITAWLGELTDDLAIKASMDYWSRLRGLEYSGDEDEFSDEDRSQVIFANNQLFEHSVLRINYTTYDLRREQDSMNPQTRADIMMLSHEDDEDRHPYWYARIIKIYHVNVWHYGPGAVPQTAPTRMHVLFPGWSAKRLHRVGFFKRDDPDSFGFVDPDQVIRGVQLIPGFSYGQTDTRLGPSFVRPPEDKDMDFMYFYVNQSGYVYVIPRRSVDDGDVEDFVVTEPTDDGDIDGEVDEGEDEDEDSDQDSDKDSEGENDGEEEDKVRADEGEELDDDVLAQEGYGAL
ncbi:hypothetical protein DFH29DRAFT_1008196 [Suillus ampliporus]|nr:hypothetical protein DFH29DRAFT_1008196 [Suillus ampliporus]